VFRLTPSEFLTKNEIDAAALVHLTEFNPQHQSRIAWPSSLVVARAYLDQLNRSKAVSAAHASAVKNAIDAADRKNPAKTAIENLSAAASQLEADAASVHGRDAERVKALSEVLRKR
jgi:hypothetical protein